MEELNSKENIIQRRISMLVTVLLVLSVLLCLYVVIQVLSQGYVNIGGFVLFRVVTGSMEPTIPVGALLVTQQVDIETLAVGDIICFRTQEAEIWGKIVTHRVVDILQNADGSLLLETKGDANLVADGFFVNSGNLVGKVIWHTGEHNVMATIFSFFTNKIGFLACIVFPCLLLASFILRDCVKNIRSELSDMMDELAQAPEEASGGAEPANMQALAGEDDVTEEEQEQMRARIRAELLEELKNGAKIDTKSE